MAEKSGIELLEELMSEVKKLNQKVDILDQNIKKIANATKVSELINRTLDTKFDSFGRASVSKPKSTNNEDSSMRFKFEPVDATKVKAPGAKIKTDEAAVVAPKSSQVMVRGKMVTVSGDKDIPLPKVSVKIYDDKDNIVKETNTNRAGMWMGLLQPGKYVVLFEGEFNGKKLSPVNKKFEVPNGVKEFEVI